MPTFGFHYPGITNLALGLETIDQAIEPMSPINRAEAQNLGFEFQK